MMKLTRYTNFDDLKSTKDSNQKTSNSPTIDLKEIEQLADFLRGNLLVKGKNPEILIADGR